MTETKLPTKLSDLLDLAVDDAEAAERMPGVVLDMDNWSRRTSNGECKVCMAGAVMLRRLGADPRLSAAAFYNPENFDDSTAVALYKIDKLRRGYALTSGLSDAAVDFIYNTLAEVRKEKAVSGNIGRASWATYRRAAAALRSAGL